MTKARSKAVRGGPIARDMATRRRSSVSFQLHENQFPLQLPETATTHGPQVGTAASRIRRALPLPLLAFGLGLAAMVSHGDKAGSTASWWKYPPGHEKVDGLHSLISFFLFVHAQGGWVWAAPAFVYAGLELYKGSKANKGARQEEREK